jgi:hypothetical protein
MNAFVASSKVVGKNGMNATCACAGYCSESVVKVCPFTVIILTEIREDASEVEAAGRVTGELCKTPHKNTPT